MIPTAPFFLEHENRMILLYYKYVDIENPEAIKREQQLLCAKLNLKGRVILATEGINGTVGGTEEACAQYIEQMNAHPLFGDIDFKTSEGDDTDFPRLSVKVKREIVRLGIDPKELSFKDAAPALSPEEWHAMLEKADEKTIIIDTRNAYELAVGTFPGALNPNTDCFADFPKFVDQHADYFQDKTILMDCTGGVRCERASAYMVKKGFKNVYHLRGGIHRYIEKFPNGFFRGKNYVFDARISVRANGDIISSCALCPKLSDDYFNCTNASCNAHFISCADCIVQYNNCCSAECQTLLATGQVKARPLRFKRSNP